MKREAGAKESRPPSSLWYPRSPVTVDVRPLYLYMLLSALAILDVGEKNTALVDVTFPAATATSNKTGTRNWSPQENIDKINIFEDKKTTHTEHDADAAKNG